MARYFLDYTQFDPNVVLTYGTENFKMQYEWLEILINQYGADVSDLGDPDTATPEWWRNIRDINAVKLVQKSLPISYSDVPSETRFSRAWDISFGGVIAGSSMFVAAAGFELNPGGLANIATDEGRTAMHFIAWTFDSSIRGDLKDYRSTFARALHDNGADLHAIHWGYTPFMSLLRQDCTDVDPWLNLLLSAGVDLRSYGRRELDIWQRTSCCISSLGPDDNRITIVSFNYGQSPSDWELLVEPFSKIPIYGLSRLPGTWIDDDTEQFMINEICWKPGEGEELEGVWHLKYHTEVIGSMRALPNKSLWPTETPQQGPYDDTTPLALMLLRPRSWSSLKRRASSQPPMDRVAKHEKVCKEADYRNDHAKDLHMCPMMADARLHYGGRPQTRDCLRGRYDDLTQYWGDAMWRAKKFAYGDDYSAYEEDYMNHSDEAPDDEELLYFDEYIAERRKEHRARKQVSYTNAS